MATAAPRSGRALPARFRELSPSAWTLLAFAGRSLLTTVVLVAGARILGADAYGELVGVTAYVLVVAPLAVMGVDELLLQRAAVTPGDLGPAWGDAILTAATIGVGLGCLVVGAAMVVLPSVGLGLVALVTATEFLAVALIGAHARAFLALSRYVAYAVTTVADGACRAAAALAFWMTGGTTALEFAAWQLGAVATAGLATGAALRLAVGPPSPSLRALIPAVRSGSRYATGLVATTVQSGIDRTMLLRSGRPDGAATYHAAVRVLGYTSLPMLALFGASRAEFFRAGSSGVESSIAFARGLLPRVLARALLAGVGAVLLAPLAALVLGDEFGGVVPIVALMAALPLVQGLHGLAGDVLTGAGHQWARARSQTVAAIANVALNLALIPPLGVAGAVIATYCSEVLLLGLVLKVVRSLRQR